MALSSLPQIMFLFSLLAFAAVLLLLGVSAARGLRNLDDILEVVDTRDAESRAPRPSV